MIKYLLFGLFLGIALFEIMYKQPKRVGHWVSRITIIDGLKTRAAVSGSFSIFWYMFLAHVQPGSRSLVPTVISMGLYNNIPSINVGFLVLVTGITQAKVLYSFDLFPKEI